MPRAKKPSSHVEVDLSEVLTSLATLGERVSNLIAEFQRERDGSAAYRHDMRKVIEALSTSFRSLTLTVDELRPLVADYREKRDQATGMIRIGRVLHAAGYCMAAFLGASFHRLFP